MTTYVFYHANCWDGIVSAWIAEKALRSRENLKLIPVNYGELPPPIETGSEVYILDFSWPRMIIETIASIATGGMVVLDHHKTAEEALKDLPFATFDMAESGASLTWNHFYPLVPPPELVQYVKDRDLWEFKLPHSEAINAFIQSFAMVIDIYDHVAKTLNSDFSSCVFAGQSILRYKQTMTNRLAEDTVTYKKVGGHVVPCVNTSILMSEVGNRLCEIHGDLPFAAYYFERADGMIQWGLRSIGDFDVSSIAKSYGGGGHKNAAGFQLPPDKFPVNNEVLLEQSGVAK